MLNKRITILPLACCLSLFAQGQSVSTAAPEERRVPTEEVLVTGDRSVMQLRIQMMNAEKQAYDIFNQYNDEKRFEIHCRMHQPTGTRIQRQVCQAGFEIEATSNHAQAYYADLRDYLDPYTSPNTSQTVQVPQAVSIASMQRKYKEKIRQVAEEHPDFLNAVIEYGALRQRYEAATSTGGGHD